jgi:formylglycine-generating enzyme required for sulfatase activity
MTDCDTSNDSAVATGSRAACVSEDGVFDMVGNLEEWVADWVPQVTRCASANAGAGPTTIGLELVDAAGEPGVLLRASSPGKPFNPVIVGPTYAVGSVGFRCAR